MTSRPMTSLPPDIDRGKWMYSNPSEYFKVARHLASQAAEWSLTKTRTPKHREERR